MKKLEIIRIKNKFDSEWHLDPVDINATLQAIIDRVNEVTVLLTAEKKEMTPEAILEWCELCPRTPGAIINPKGMCTEHISKRFKAKDIERDGRTLHFWTEAEAQAALELLLNL